MESFFEFDHLAAGYGTRPVVSGVDLSLKKGEIMTLIGPNGSGKSTLLKTASRRIPALSGRVLLEGRDIRSMSGAALARKMAVVLTDGARPQLMTCFDVAAAGRYPYTGSFGLLTARDKEIVRRSLNEVNAGDIAGADFASVSDGQRQRVLLARAMAQEPELIILDEPTSFLDIRHKIELLEILRAMARNKGVTVLMSLHEIDLASKVSDVIACVSSGGISAWGPPEKIITDGSVSALYGIERGSYSAALGCVELSKPQGAPRVFVLGGGGYGIPVYRKLQKAGIPFAAGILFENDVELPAARALAARVIESPPFRPVSEARLSEARAAVDSSEALIHCGCPTELMSPVSVRLLEYAVARGKRVIQDISEADI